MSDELNPEEAFRNLPPLRRGEPLLDFDTMLKVDDRLIQSILVAGRAARLEKTRVVLNRPPRELVKRILQAGLEDRFALRIQSLAAERERRGGLASAIRKGFPILVPAALAATLLVRDLAAQLAREVGFSEDDLADIELCVGEASVNAVRHGCAKEEQDRFIVRFFQEDSSLTIEIRDEGNGFNFEQVPQPDAQLLKENGLGIFLMRSLMDRVDIQVNGETVVRLEKRLPLSQQ